MQDNLRKKGRCSSFEPAKGFGFIIPDNSGKDDKNKFIFVHKKEIQKISFQLINWGIVVIYIVAIGIFIWVRR